MMIHNDRIEDNDVNETGYEGLSSGSDGVPGQAPLGRQPATGRRKWNNAVNRVVMECYFESEPTVRGYRKRMLSAWRGWDVARMIHWNIAHSYGLDVSNKWYEHKPEGVIENDHVKLLWDFNIQTSTYIQGRRPDVVVVDRDKKTCNIIDIAVPGDAGIVEKEKEKVEKYQDLRREVTRLWNVKAKVVPIVVGALGAVTPNLSKYLDAIGVATRIELLQKAALLGTARLLRRVLEA